MIFGEGGLEFRMIVIFKRTEPYKCLQRGFKNLDFPRTILPIPNSHLFNLSQKFHQNFKILTQNDLSITKREGFKSFFYFGNSFIIIKSPKHIQEGIERSAKKKNFVSVVPLTQISFLFRPYTDDDDVVFNI